MKTWLPMPHLTFFYEVTMAAHHPCSPELDVVTLLAQQRPTFLAFVQRRVKDAAVAEDLLQEAFMRGINNAASLREEGALLGWFYRILRNAVIDYHRGSARYGQRLAELAHDLEAVMEAEPEARGDACQCIAPLAKSLKPEYASALASIDVDGVSVKDYAEHVGISSTNAGVRVHRARHALRERVMENCGACASEGCGQCTCP